jgi:hypothetical protein
MTTDYLLKFPDRATAVQFGLANGFAVIDEDGNEQITLASHEYALCIIGEHWIAQPDIDGEPQPAIGDGQWWVLFRDLIGIPIPEGGEQFIYWASDFTVDDEDGNPVPVPRPISDDVPNIWWA